MFFHYILNLFLVIELMKHGAKLTSVHALSMQYYAIQCPLAEMFVKNTVNQALQNDPTLAAGLLRMHFHDCFVEGCDGSVLIDSTKNNTAEKDSPANLSLRGYEVIDKAKELIENQCPGVVSCADIVAMAARDAVFWAGGPVYDIPMGRKDGRRSRIEDTINLPAPILNATSLIKMFSKHGFTVQDLVALSGGHTLGVARCSSFKNRLSNFDATHNVDPSMNSRMATILIKQCQNGDDVTVALDQTKNSFDNAYFNAVQSSAGLLTSDQTLYMNPRTRGWIDAYAMNQARFFLDFQSAMVKMGLIDVKEGNDGEIRLDCRVVN
ncbi:Class I peroxidase protein [Dioscorea alata]|uniref:Class I peroxidase protein n=1 Tax=Dioscorea alata TaxID=55571 RepID=A0ACB7USZ3_DIOAL|nr:Class I peroxidase protein [Dioscorea alata]